MAFQTEIRIAYGQHLAIDGAVRIVANRAALAQGFVLENKWARLLAMTTGATFVLSRHGQAPSRFENVEAMRIMALDAIHFAFDDWVALRQIELSVSLKMALETCSRVLPRIDDELPASAARGDVLASGPMAGFATGLANELGVGKMDPRVRAGGKGSADVGVAIVTRLIADVTCARNFWRSEDGAGQA